MLSSNLRRYCNNVSDLCCASPLAPRPDFSYENASFEKFAVSISRLGINDANVTVSQFPRLCHFYPSNAMQCSVQINVKFLPILTFYFSFSTIKVKKFFSLLFIKSLTIKNNFATENSDFKIFSTTSLSSAAFVSSVTWKITSLRLF